MKKEQSRKDFLRKIGLSLGGFVAEGAAASENFVTDEDKLNEEQKEFLNLYQIWLAQFQEFIQLQKKDFTNVENNKKLMELSTQAAEWREQLAEFMDDEAFATCYEHITTEVTRDIE